MPEPTRVCIEDLAPPPGSERVLVCTAVPGRQPGLGLDRDGAVCWKRAQLAAELWVTADDRLALYVRGGAPTVILQRGGRRLTAPEEHPIIVLDGDLVSIAERRYLLHVHGPAAAIVAPTPLGAAAVGAASPRTRTASHLPAPAAVPRPPAAAVATRKPSAAIGASSPPPPRDSFPPARPPAPPVPPPGQPAPPPDDELADGPEIDVIDQPPMPDEPLEPEPGRGMESDLSSDFDAMLGNLGPRQPAPVLDERIDVLDQPPSDMPELGTPGPEPDLPDIDVIDAPPEPEPAAGEWLEQLASPPEIDVRSASPSPPVEPFGPGPTVPEPAEFDLGERGPSQDDTEIESVLDRVMPSPPEPAEPPAPADEGPSYDALLDAMLGGGGDPGQKGRKR